MDYMISILAAIFSPLVACFISYKVSKVTLVKPSRIKNALLCTLQDIEDIKNDSEVEEIHQITLILFDALTPDDCKRTEGQSDYDWNRTLRSKIEQLQKNISYSLLDKLEDILKKGFQLQVDCYKSNGEMIVDVKKAIEDCKDYYKGDVYFKEVLIKSQISLENLHKSKIMDIADELFKTVFEREPGKHDRYTILENIVYELPESEHTNGVKKELLNIFKKGYNTQENYSYITYGDIIDDINNLINTIKRVNNFSFHRLVGFVLIPITVVVFMLFIGFLHRVTIHSTHISAVVFVEPSGSWFNWVAFLLSFPLLFVSISLCREMILYWFDLEDTIKAGVAVVIVIACIIWGWIPSYHIGDTINVFGEPILRVGDNVSRLINEADFYNARNHIYNNFDAIDFDSRPFSNMLNFLNVPLIATVILFLNLLLAIFCFWGFLNAIKEKSMRSSWINWALFMFYVLILVYSLNQNVSNQIIHHINSNIDDNFFHELYIDESGIGHWKSADGASYVGQFNGGAIIGNGIFTRTDGIRLENTEDGEGIFVFGKLFGLTRIYSANNESIGIAYFNNNDPSDDIEILLHHIILAE